MLYRSQFSTDYAYCELFRQLMNHIIILMCLPADRACCLPIQILVSPSQRQSLSKILSIFQINTTYQKLFRIFALISQRFSENYFTFSAGYRKSCSKFFVKVLRNYYQNISNVCGGCQTFFRMFQFPGFFKNFPKMFFKFILHVFELFP